MPRSLLLVVAPLASFAVAACSGAGASGDAEKDGTLTTRLSTGGGPVVGLAGKCLDDAGDGTSDGNRVQLYTCNGTDAQSWTLVNGRSSAPRASVST